MKTLHYRHAFLTVAVVALLSGCGSRGGEPLTDSERAAICEPGITRECVGRGACRGGQQCGDDARWGACECASGANNPAAGAPGIGSSWTGLAGFGAMGASSHSGVGATAGWGNAPVGGAFATSKGGTTSGGTTAKGGTSAGGINGTSKGGTTAKGGTSAGGTAVTTTGGTSTHGGAGPGGSSNASGGTTEISTGGTGVGGAYGGTTHVATGGYATGGSYGGSTNQAPTITSLRFSTSTLHTNDTIWIDAVATDPESDRVYFTYAWKRNGEPVGKNSNSLDGWFYFERGDQINVTVTPNDAGLSGIPVTSSTLIVENATPYFYAFPSIASGLLSDDAAPLVCEVTAQDQDGDAVAYKYQWYLNGALTTHSEQTLPASVTKLGDRWACNVILTDGNTNGESSGMSGDTTIVSQVSGIYRTDTTWDASRSPYYLSGRVQVATGVTLTIGPGVTVVGDDNSLESWGNISAVGTQEKPIFIRDVTFWDYSTAQSPGKWTLAFAEITGGALGASTANVSLTASDCVFRDTWSTIYLTTGTSSAHRFERNVFQNCCGILSSAPLVLISNVFASREASYCLDVAAQDALTATNNTFFPTKQASVSLGAKSADLRNNYWGGVSDKEVPDRIIDNNDDLNIQGIAEYLPTLSSPHADTPSQDKTYGN